MLKRSPGDSLAELTSEDTDAQMSEEMCQGKPVLNTPEHCIIVDLLILFVAMRRQSPFYMLVVSMYISA